MFVLSSIERILMGIPVIQRQSMITLFSKLGLTFVGFLATMYFAHVLGPAILGAYFLFLAYLGIFNLIGDGGFGGAAVKRISEGKEQNEYFSAYVILRILFVIILVISLFATQTVFKDLQSSGLFLWLILSLIIGTIFGIVSNGVYGSGKVGIFQLSGLINNVVKVIFQVLAVILGYEVAGLAGGVIVGLIVGTAICLKYLDLKLISFHWKHVLNLTTFSFWIFLTSSGLLVFTYADTIIVGYFLSNSDVGVYRVAFQLSTAATFIALSLQNVLYPKMSEWSSTNRYLLVERALSRSITYSLLLAIPVCFGGWLLGERLLYYLYGAPFAEARDVLLILLIVQVVMVFMYLQTMSLNALNQPKASFRATAIAVIINIGLNFVLIPLIGISGAALATLVSMTINSFFAYTALSKQISVQLEYRCVLNILIAATIMAIFVFIYQVFIPLETALYALGTVVFGAIIYSVILLKIDRGIHDDIMELTKQLGLPWPLWL